MTDKEKDILFAEKHEPVQRCPYYDEDCSDVVKHADCWAGLNTDDPFPGYCPYVK